MSCDTKRPSLGISYAQEIMLSKTLIVLKYWKELVKTYIKTALVLFSFNMWFILAKPAKNHFDFCIKKNTKSQHISFCDLEYVTVIW